MARADGEYVQSSNDDSDVDMGVMDDELEPSRGPKKSLKGTKKGSKSKGKGKANEVGANISVAILKSRLNQSAM